MEELPVDSLIKSIKEPRNLGSFYTEAGSIRIRQVSGEVLNLEKLSPFATISDLKLAIYKRTGTAPEMQCLARKSLETYFPIDYLWTKPGDTRELALVSPMVPRAVSKQAPIFVDAAGERRILSFSSRQRIQYENYLARLNPKPQELYLFTYEAVKGQYAEMSERIWYGSLYPYFPLLSYGRDTVSQSNLEKRVKQFDGKQEIIRRIEQLLDTLLPLTCGGVRYLQLQWLNEISESNYIENLFYTVPVTKNLVYMRLLPQKGTAVTKFHLLKDQVPDIADPKLLKQWTKERNPTPEHDFILAKGVLRPAIAQQPPLYMTLRLYERGSADAVIAPQRNVRKLDVNTDLETQSFTANFKAMIRDLPFANQPVRLVNSSFIYGLHLPPKAEIFNRERMKKRLPIFAPFFTEIAPLPGETPLLMLRYKCVDNYATESRIFTFLTLISNRKLIQGEALVTQLVDMLEDEFQLDTEEARTYVARWFKSKGEYQLAAGDTKEFLEMNQTGIDVAIFSQHPFYTFHLTNVDGNKNLQRILTLISVLFSASDIQLGISSKLKAAVQEAEPEELEILEDEEDAPPVELDPLFAQFAAADEDEVESPKITELVARNSVAPKVDLARAPIAETASVSTTADEGLADFFLAKLKEADRRLFDYEKLHPSSKKYVAACAANVTRQPSVITRAQYEEMRDVIYKDDIDSLRINFIVYPKEAKDTAKNLKGNAETFYFMRYGTSAEKFNDNYYVCSKYFCTRDNLIIIEEDFKGTKLRRPTEFKANKAPNTCPFCEGMPVKNRRKPGLNETVLVRLAAPNTPKDAPKFHTYVGFLAKAPHPEGFYLPCCFLKPETIYVTDKYYDKLKDMRIDLMPGKGLTPIEDEDEEEVAAAGLAQELRPMITKQLYMTSVKRVVTKFIVGAEKLPLEIDADEGAQIGLLPALLDGFFEQSSADLINPKGEIHKLKPGARGFLRIGVENRSRFKADSFMAAIAPFYNVEGAEAMKNLIWQTLQHRPNIFLQLNYGNFLIEFYDVNQRFPTEAECSRFLEGADTNNWEEALQIPGFSKARQRFLCAFSNFHDWLFREDTVKEYRQFAQLLALPNTLLRPAKGSSVPGITFIVLKLTEDGKLKVHCPAYSFNAAQQGNNDIAFLLWHHSGIWEPLFYVDNRSTVEPATFLFQRAEEGSIWPEIVKRRVAEFGSMDGCYSTGKFSYASRQILNPQRMLPASRLAKLMNNKGLGFDGILRDPYNHLVALVFENPEQENLFIPVPCVDDGLIFPTKKIYLDWKDCATAPIDTVLEFYVENIEPLSSSLYGSFAPKEIWYYSSTPKSPKRLEGYICGILLENLQFVPLRSYGVKGLQKTQFVDGSDGVFYAFGEVLIPARYVLIDELELEISKKIIFEGVDADEDEEMSNISIKDLQDIYEHFRITFASWLAEAPEHAVVREKIQDILESEESLAEKRKALQIILESGKVLSWISSAEPVKTASSIRRVDCTQMNETSCSGRCVWNTDKCFIHAPETTTVGKGQVDTARLFMYKLIDEILRFSEKRNELFDNSMSRLSSVDREIIEGEQRIIPENTAAWYELLRSSWTASETEAPRFFEEQSRRLTKDEQIPPSDEATRLPVLLQTYLSPTDPATATFRLLRAPMDTLFSRISFRVNATRSSFTEEDLEKITRATKYPIAQIDLRTEDVKALAASTKAQMSEYFILVLTETGPSLLVKDPDSDALPLLSSLPVKIQELFREKTRPVAAAMKKTKIRFTNPGAQR